MRCSKCGGHNREGRKFCGACGATLTLACPKCGASNQPEENFCGECGAGLTDATIVKPPEVKPIAATNGERRHLTVLFCDLVGSTQIASQLDPEEWRELVAGYHHSAAEAINLYGGYVAQYSGDGVMAYFGWPEAHEDDAARAARAGLAILDEIAKLNQQSTHPKISVRVGIDSGAVVVGAGAGKDADVFGETPNIAARVQSAAAPDTVLMTGATHRLLSGLFLVQELGAQELRGVANPVELYRVLRPSGVRGRLAAARGLTPFIGREEELRLLLSRWERAREGEGQLVLVVGEAGIGKSRLIAEFHHRIRDTPHWIESGGEQFFENSPFHAVTEMLSQWLELGVDSKGDDRIDHLERTLAAGGLKPEEAAPLILDLLQIPVGERYPAITLTPEQRRRRLLAALTGWIFGVVRLQPAVMVVEDLHWLDPSSLELVQLLAEQGVTLPLMLLCTARPEFHPQWPVRSHHTQIALNRLSAGNAREIVALVAAQNALTSVAVEAVIERTGGVPLFLEELTRAVLEVGAVNLSAREIPVTLHDSLMARLDRLGSAKEVLQIGSVIGGEFTYELLHAVHPLNDEDLQSELHRLTDGDLLHARGLPPDATYQFKHALLADAAYDALLRSRRKQLHARVAEVLVQRFPETVTSTPERLAHHYTEAGRFEEAIPMWQKAGQKAIARSADAEAISHFTKALALLQATPESPRRTEQELTLQILLGVPLIATKGWGDAEVERSYDRARILCERSNDSEQLATIVYGLWQNATTTGELARAHEFAEQLKQIAQRRKSSSLLLVANFALAMSLYYQGQLARARDHADEGLTLYNTKQDRQLIGLYGQDLGVSCEIVAGWSLCQLGYPEEAIKRVQHALTLAEELSHAFTSAIALAVAGIVHLYRRDAEATKDSGQKMTGLSAEHGISFFHAWGTILEGWAFAQQGQKGHGLRLIREGLAASRLTGARIWQSLWLALQVELCSDLGEIEAAKDSLAEAFSYVAQSHERFYESELHRLKGNLALRYYGPHLTGSSIQEAEGSFREAIQIAREQQAKSMELRATTSLARLLSTTNRRKDAQPMLNKIYNWFTEGFDTADLKEAKALLDELSA